MRGTIIERQIRRCNRNLILVNAGILAFLLFFLILSQRYLYNCVAGPFPMSANELQAIDFSEREKFVSITDDLAPIDTGAYIRHTRSGAETSKDYFLAARVGERLLLIKTPSATPVKHYEGGLASIPGNIRGLIEDDVKKDGSRFDELFLPLMLDSSSYRSDAYLWIGLGVPVFGLCLFNLKKAFTRSENVQHSPTYRAVVRYGDNVEDIAKAVDAEASSKDVEKFGSLTLTPSWLLHKTFFSFTPFHLSDIVWTYPRQTQNYYYFIPTGKSHAIVVADAAGRTAEADLGRRSGDDVDKFIKLLQARIPWVVTGYNDELKDLYSKNLSAFVASVFARRQQYETPAAE